MATRARPRGCCKIEHVRPLGDRAQGDLVALLRALGDATRVEILRLVSAQRGPVCACDIVEHFDLSQPTISHHLKVLRESGLLRTRKRGIWSFWEPDPRGRRLLDSIPELVAG